MYISSRDCLRLPRRLYSCRARQTLFVFATMRKSRNAFTASLMVKQRVPYRSIALHLRLASGAGAKGRLNESGGGRGGVSLLRRHDPGLLGVSLVGGSHDLDLKFVKAIEMLRCNSI